MDTIAIPESSRRWDVLSLGEVMLRLDPGESRIHTTRQFQVWEGGGEYNVARGLRRCFGLRAGIVTALADNPVGRLVEDFILQGGVDVSLIRWIAYDGVGRTVRNGLNFTERGHGARAAVGCNCARPSFEIEGCAALSKLLDSLISRPSKGAHCAAPGLSGGVPPAWLFPAACQFQDHRATAGVP